MDKPFDYKQFMKQLQACQQRSRRTLLNIDNTLADVKNTLKDISDTTGMIDRVKQQYNEVMDKLIQKIGASFNTLDDPFKKIQGVKYENLPQKITESQLVSKIMKHNQILIITGAGVSAESGIPTFRGKGGLYSTSFKVNQKEYPPDEFITANMYRQHPRQIWDWVRQIYSLSVNSKPNSMHVQIDKLGRLLGQMGKSVVLATQNIDDLHLKPQSNEYQYLNIHGNCKLVHCPQFHFQPFNPADNIRQCTICHKPVRPYVLFFDQRYGSYYGEQIKDKRFKFVICVGTSLKTGLAINMVRDAEEVVEINPNPVIEIGKVYRFDSNSKDVLAKINYYLKSSMAPNIQTKKA